MIKAVVFDFFEVLYLNGINYFFDTYATVPLDRDELIRQSDAYDRGRVSYDQRLHDFAVLAGVSYETVRDKMLSGITRNDRLFARIQKLRSEGYALGLLSNIGPGTIEQIVSEAELEQYFDAKIFSYQVGLAKPDAEIFELVAQRLATPVEDCVFVDDNPRNYEGALRAGMRAIQYQDFAQFESELDAMLYSS